MQQNKTNPFIKMTTIKKIMILDRLKLPLELIDIVRDYAFVHIETKRLEQKKRKYEVLKNISGDYFNSYLVNPKHVTYDYNNYHFKHELQGRPFVGSLKINGPDGFWIKSISTCLFCGNYCRYNLRRSGTMFNNKIKCKCSDGYYEKRQKHDVWGYLDSQIICEKHKCDSGYNYHKRAWYTPLFFEK